MDFITLTDKDFIRFSSLVYEKSGINLGGRKKELVRNRLAKRLREKGLKNYSDYYEFIKEDTTGEELTRMIDAISTNVTSFFREPKHFSYIESCILPELQKNGQPKFLRIWSAGCSTGEEPYTISICLKEYIDTHKAGNMNYGVLASDLSTRVLEAARKGIYPEASLDKMSETIKKKYFKKGTGKKNGFVKVKPVVAEPVTFSQLNLMNPPVFENKFDVIFCRNVLIYFTEKDQQRHVNFFYKNLKPGGHLFIGHSESLMKFRNFFKYVGPTIYKRPTS